VEEFVVAYFKVLSWYLHEENEGDHEKS